MSHILFKKIIKTVSVSVALLFLLLVLVGHSLTPTVALAQTTSADPNDPATKNLGSKTMEDASKINPNDKIGTSSKGVNSNTSDSASKSGWFSTTASNIAEAMIRWACTSVLTLTGYLLSWSAMLLNIILYTTIVKMKSVLENITVIDTVWKVVRDFLNMFFIFGILWAALYHIVGQDVGRGLRTVIFHIIVGAVFMNFSLTMTKVLIDFSNVATIGLYEQLPGVSIDKPDAPGLSNSIMQSIKLQSIFAAGSSTDTVGNLIQETGATLSNVGLYVIATLMGSFLMLMTSFLFLAASFLFIARFIMLLFLLALSPVAFAGWALPFPQISAQSTRWWKTLSGQLTFPIVYMLMLWISFQIIVEGNIAKAMGIDSGKRFIDSFSDLSSSTIGLVLNYVIVMGFMFQSIILAAQANAYGAKTIQAWGAKQAKNLGGAIGRNTVGRAAVRLQESGAVKTLQSVAPSLGGAVSRTIGTVADAKFGSDKNFRGAVKARADQAEAGYKNVTNPGTITRRTLRFESDEKFKARKEAAEANARSRGETYVKSISGETMVGTATDRLLGTSPAQEAERKAVADAAKAQKQKDEQKDREKRNTGSLKEALAMAKGTPQEIAERNKKIREAINKMGNKEVVALGTETLLDADVVNNLKDSHFEEIEKADATAISDEKKAEIRAKRYEAFTSAIASGNAAGVASAIGNMSEKTLQGINIDALTDDQRRGFIDNLKSSQFLKLLTSNDLKAPQKEILRSDRYRKIDKRNTGSYTIADIPAIIGRLSPAEIADLDSEILEDPEIIKNLRVEALNEMIKENVSYSTRQKIQTEIENIYRTAASGPATAAIDKMHAWLTSPAGINFA